MRTLSSVWPSGLEVLLGLGAIAGTLGGVAPAWAISEAPASCSQTSSAADGHTCGHGRGGPFANRVGISYPHTGSAFDIQNVDPTHTLFTVLLSEASASGQWVVSYQPSVAGTYGFYLDLPGTEAFGEQPYEFELRDLFGDAVPIRLEHVVSACPGYLAWVKVYELEPARYHLVLGGEANANVQVAVEHMDAFGQELFADADGDGYGRPGTSLASWCGEAEGYSAVGTDCDDDDPSVFPDDVGMCRSSNPCREGEPQESCAGGTGSGLGDPTGSGGMGGAFAGTGGKSSAGAADPGGAAGAGARGDTHGDGGGESSAGLAGGHTDGDPGGNGSSVDDAGCSCRIGTRPSATAGPWPALLVLGHWLIRRRSVRGRPEPG